MTHPSSPPLPAPPLPSPARPFPLPLPSPSRPFPLSLPAPLPPLPQVQALAKYKCIAVACGGRNAHTLAATEDGSIWCWGDHTHGKLGVGGLGAGPELLPRKLGKLDGGGIAQLECGPHFSVALTKEGKVYSWSAPA